MNPLALLLLPLAAQPLVPTSWDPALAGDLVMERFIMFGKLEDAGAFESQAGKSRKPVVSLIMDKGAGVQPIPQAPEPPPINALTEPPVILTDPGPAFQDEARPGAMIIGMDRTRKGRIWGCWTGTGDKRDGYFLLATSDDGGATWSKPRLVVGALDPSGKRQRGALVGNLWTDPLGRLWLFFDQTVIGAPGPTGNWFIRCDDPDAGNPVWSEPVCFAEGCTLNKPTVLENGDWLLPVSHWATQTAWVYASTDQGRTWKPRGSTKFPDWNFDEHMMIELRDGRLWMLARTNGNPYETFSTDKGATWSEPKPAATVQNINARFFLRRLGSGKILLVKNGPPNERLSARSHMSAFLSEDEGQTWRGSLLLDERSGVSYPDGFQAPDGLIHILYDWNRHTDAEILLAKFREEDVLTGKPVSPDAKLQILANKATGPKPILYNGHITAENCIPLQGDSTRARLAWRGVENLAGASGKNVRLRFTLTNGSLYSFWVTPDENGASNGYVAAGGPAFPGTMDTAAGIAP